VSPPLLRIQEATKTFQGLCAVNRVSFDVGKGEMISIVGPNGAGKTTLFNLITGQLPATSGTIHFRDISLGGLSPHRRAALGIGRTFQIAKPLLSLTVLENAVVGAFLHNRKLYDAEEKAMAVLDEVGLAHKARNPATDLTLSERRRLEVARALALDPDAILLDEVMAGLNPAEVDKAIALYLGLHARGLTFIVIEHNLKVVRAFGGRTIVLHHGELLAQGTADEILNAPEVVEAYIGRKGK
jgi:branched-chain amino acid transport system ATP-binding protein